MQELDKEGSKPYGLNEKSTFSEAWESENYMRMIVSKMAQMAQNHSKNMGFSSSKCGNKCTPSKTYKEENKSKLEPGDVILPI